MPLFCAHDFAILSLVEAAGVEPAYQATVRLARAMSLRPHKAPPRYTSSRTSNTPASKVFT